MFVRNILAGDFSLTNILSVIPFCVWRKWDARLKINRDYTSPIANGFQYVGNYTIIIIISMLRILIIIYVPHEKIFSVRMYKNKGTLMACKFHDKI